MFASFTLRSSIFEGDIESQVIILSSNPGSEVVDRLESKKNIEGDNSRDNMEGRVCYKFIKDSMCFIYHGKAQTFPLTEEDELNPLKQSGCKMYLDKDGRKHYLFEL